MVTVVYSPESLQKPMGLQEVISNLEAVVEDYGPDWVDPNADGTLDTVCKNVYWDDDGEERLCIAAKCIKDSFSFIDSDWLLDHNSEAIDEVIVWGGDEFPIKADRLIDFSGEAALQLAQNLQDKGIEWGFVLWYIKKSLGSLIEIDDERSASDTTAELTRSFSLLKSRLFEEYRENA